MQEYYKLQTCSRQKTLGMPVLSINNGQLLGKIKQVLLDGKTYRVIGFVTEKRMGNISEERILPLHQVNSFGRDSITVSDVSVLERKGHTPQYIPSIRRPLTVIGSRVFTVGGNIVGKTEDFLFEISDGSLAYLQISLKDESGCILAPGRRIIAIAPQTIIMKDQALEESIIPDVFTQERINDTSADICITEGR